MSSAPLSPGIFFASATGTAEDAAMQLHEACRVAGLPASLAALNALTPAVIPRTSVALFIVATTGDGEMPASGAAAWKLLRLPNLPRTALQHMRFAVFGFGDSSYRQYNVAARALFARLIQLGAKPLCVLGVGDDQLAAGPFPAFHRWQTAVLSGLGVSEIPAAHSQASSSSACTPALKPSLPSLSMASVYQACLSSPACPAAKLRAPGVHMVRLEAREQLVHGQPERQVYGLTFASQPERPVQYRPGDVAMLWPTNEFAQGGRTPASEGTSLALVPRLLSRMHTEADCMLSVHAPTPGEPVHVRALPAAARPCVVPASYLCTSVLDIAGMPSRWALSHLARHSSDAEHAARLHDMASAEGSDLYHTYIRVPRRSWVEVLEDFTSIDVSWHDLANLVPVIPPRQFSIASAPNPAGTLELCVGLVQRARGKRVVCGLASDWLGRIVLGTEVPLALVASEFADCAWSPCPGRTASSSLAGPCLAVCGGTGVAPVRAVSQALAASPGAPERTRMWTFFGCRHAAGDFLYAAEWAARAGLVDCPSQPLPAEAQRAAGAPPADASQRLTAAFSRDLNRKVYVQHQIAAHAAAVAGLLRQAGSLVWLVGASKGIVEGAEDAIKEVAVAHGLVSSESAAAQWVATMKAGHRWFAECWS